MRQKRPIITVAAIDVQCPECGEFIAAESGALYFEIIEVRTGERHECLCGYAFTFSALSRIKMAHVMPARVRS